MKGTTTKSVVPIVLRFSLPGQGATRPGFGRTWHQHHTTRRARSRSIGTPEAPIRRSNRPSFPENDITTFTRCGRINRCDHSQALTPRQLPASSRTAPFHRNAPHLFHRNAIRPIHSFMNDESRRSSIPRFASTSLALIARTLQRAGTAKACRAVLDQALQIIQPESVRKHHLDRPA